MVPNEIKANFNLTITLEDKAASVPDGYTPKFMLGGAASLTVEGMVVGYDVLYELVPADTVNLATGQYWFQAVAEDDDGNRVLLDEGTVYVSAKITGAGVYDGRSVAEKILEAIDAAMLGKATKDQQSYMIQSGAGSRSLSRLSLLELKQVREYYAQIVAQEKRSSAEQPLFRRHKFAFTDD